MKRTARLAVTLALPFVAAAGCRARAPSVHATAPVTDAGTPAPADAIVRAVTPPRGGGIVLLDFDGRHRAVVADDDAGALQLVDLASRTVVSTTPLGGAPGQILLAPDGTLFVAVRDAARVVALRFVEDGTTRERARHPTGGEPYGLALALTEHGATLLVTTIAEPRIEALSAEGLAPVFATPLPRNPRGVVVASGRAFVAHATGSTLSVVDLGAETRGTARAVALDTLERRRDFGMTLVTKAPMPMKRTALPEVRVTMKRTANQSFGLAVVEGDVLVPETLVLTGPKDAIPSGYGAVEQSTLGTHVPFVARVRVDGEKLANDKMSGPNDRACFEAKAECIVPRAVVEDGGELYVACIDADEVLVVDPARDAEHAPDCQKTLAARVRIPVTSPTAVAVDGASIVAFSAFTRTLTIAPRAGGAPVTIAMPGGPPVSAAFAEGRHLFPESGDPRIAQNGRACASCHVEGRDDGIVWPTPRGKRQTPMLAGRLEGTAPYGWSGEHPTLAAHIASTLKNLEGTGLPPHETDALAAYVTGMKAATRRAEPSAEVARGEAIFESDEAGCSSCHVPAARFTDGETHALFGKTPFDTPSLAYVGQTAPYFHDGRFATLEALVDGCEDPPTRMGKTKHLDAEGRRALVAYLRSL
jgi:DNA-binding beta-propeller fold protein YncE